MLLPRLCRVVTCICTLLSCLTTSAQSLSASVNLPQFYDFYNLQHIILGSLSEQDCIRINSDTCLKLAFRQLANSNHTASRKTLWITTSARMTEMIDAGITLDPGISETTPSTYNTSNKRPALAGFVRWNIAQDMHLKFIMAYNSSAPQFTQDVLSTWHNEISTGTSAGTAAIEIGARMPVQFGLIQPYLLVNYKQVTQSDYSATYTTRLQLATTTLQSGFRTIYTLNERLQLSMNLYAERDIMQRMHITQSQSHDTGMYHIPQHQMEALRFGISAGGRIIIRDNHEFTMLISRFTQPFGNGIGTGAAVYYLLRL